MGYIEEIETPLDNDMPDDVKFKLRRNLGYTVFEVLVRQRPRMPEVISVDLGRAFVTLGEPEFATFKAIHDPDELVLIARLALYAWEQMVRLKAANTKLESAG